ncbi:TPA: type IV secretion system protein TraC [Legionella pneumophila]|nr:type IV secretion system protein TraC [Legionella pneumophila]HBD9260145.1 type IV secretion system protein TraC [Legionella pneumophila]HCX3262779.1 type IV secretion system protein TraC [Legionella pneumophila]HCX3599099.1 type IV secretion system protein TraC [Legionella pneumophila]HDI4841895.1 type IV secretion system protein TraC [Legionella pneumophila]
MFTNAIEWVQDTYELLKETWNDKGLKGNESDFDLKTHQYPSFTEKILPYQYFDEESKLFFNEYNAGLIYRIIPLTGANEHIAEQLDTLLQSKVSHEFTLQLICVKHNQVGNDIEAFTSQFAKSEFENLSLLGDNLKAFYQKAAIHGFKTNTMLSPRLTHTDCYIVIDKIKKESESDLKACFGQFRVSFEASLSAAKIGFKQADATDFLHLLHFYLDNCPDVITPRPVIYDKTKLLKEQALSHDFDIEFKNNEVVIKGVNESGRAYETAVSVLTIDRLPRQYCLWENINNTSNIFHPDKRISCNHIISVIYLVEEQGRAQGRANRKTRDLDKKSKSDYALNVAGTEEQARVWRTFRDDLSSQKTRSVKMLYNVVLFSRPHEKERDVEAARTVFAFNDIKLALCKRMQCPYFLVSMPFFFTGNLVKDFSLPTMMWPISSWNATQYMPILSDWRGVGKGILLPTMRDQFACIDPFSGVFGSNYNMAVTGTSGGGKSFFIQMLMLNILFNGGDIFIIDVGGSYRKLCEALGGTYLEYSNLAMNPFTHVTDILREIDDIIALFELLTCPTSGATDDDRGTLREAILTAFGATQNQTRIDEVAGVLLSLYEHDRETYPTARILSKNLQRYCSASEHGKAFNEPSQLSPDARMIVVDLKEIEDNQSIRAPVLLSVISQFQRRMFNSDRNKQKMCIIDEAWSFFTGDSIAVNFITKGFRTGRRHKASFVTITQGIEDYFEFSEARAAWENSALKLVFLQEESPLLEHQKKHETFSDYEMTILKSFPIAKEAGFSQVLLRANGISSFHRLFVDPFTRVLLSSDGDDYQAVINYVAQGLLFLDAVSQVAKEHYGRAYAA